MILVAAVSDLRVLAPSELQAGPFDAVYHFQWLCACLRQ
jgi:hypothetical protein